MRPPTFCGFCGQDNALTRVETALVAHYQGFSVDVTRVKRTCQECGESICWSRDPDFAAEAREKLNAALGQSPETRLPHVRYEPAVKTDA